MPQFLNRVRTAALRLTGGSPGSDKVVVGDSQGEASWAKIVNANVDSSAGIAFSKMETGNPNQIVRASQSGVPELAYLAVDVPIGTVVPYMFPTPPVGFLVCDGSVLSRTTYADLFALANSASLIGTVFGAGDGSTTFTLPDMRGRTMIGSGQGSGLTDRTLGSTGGAETHQLSTAEMPSHTHTQNAHGHTHNANAGLGGYGLIRVSPGNSNTISVTDTTPGEPDIVTTPIALSINQATATNQNTGGDGSHNNMQPYIALNYIIKATYSTLLGDSHAEASEAFTVFMGN